MEKGSTPFVKIMRALGDSALLYQTIVRLEKFLPMHFRKEKRGTAGAYQQK